MQARKTMASIGTFWKLHILQVWTGFFKVKQTQINKNENVSKVLHLNVVCLLHVSFQLLCTMSLNILCIIVTIIAASLTIVELSHFRSVSYRNYGQAVSNQFYRKIFFTFVMILYPLKASYNIVWSYLPPTFPQLHSDTPPSPYSNFIFVFCLFQKPVETILCCPHAYRCKATPWSVMTSLGLCS